MLFPHARARDTQPVRQARRVPEKLHGPAGIESRLDERDETPLIWAVSEGYHDIALT